MTLQDLIKAIEKAKIPVWNDKFGTFGSLVDADILLAELKKMEE